MGGGGAAVTTSTVPIYLLRVLVPPVPSADKPQNRGVWTAGKPEIFIANRQEDVGGGN